MFGFVSCTFFFDWISPQFSRILTDKLWWWYNVHYTTSLLDKLIFTWVPLNPGNSQVRSDFLHVWERLLHILCVVWLYSLLGRPWFWFPQSLFYLVSVMVAFSHIRGPEDVGALQWHFYCCSLKILLLLEQTTSPAGLTCAWRGWWQTVLGSSREVPCFSQGTSVIWESCLGIYFSCLYTCMYPTMPQVAHYMTQLRGLSLFLSCGK